MRKSLLVLTSIIIFWSGLVIAEDKKESRGMPLGMKGGYETLESEIFKVFAVEEDGARYRAYLVKWKGHEVIAMDPLGRTDKKKGEKATFMAQRIEIPGPDGTMKMLQFMIMEFDVFPERSIKKQKEN